MRADSFAIRVAHASDANAIVTIVNDAYQVEAFFVGGDRIGPADVLGLIDAGACLVAEEGGQVVACVQVAARAPRGYFGMLAVAPAVQGRGLGRRLIAVAESTVRAAGCALMDIKVVNLRTDLVAFYQSLGYRTTGTEPYEHRPVLQPCHFVLMEKRL